MANKLKQSFQYLWNHKRITIPVVLILLFIMFLLRPKPAPGIETTTIAHHDITQSVSVSGSVVAKTTANLSFPISGTISWVGVKQGDTITQGQTIATLDQRTVLKNLQNALINYNLQRNTYDQTIVNNNGISDPQNALNDNMRRILQNNQDNLDLAVNSVELQDLARQQSILSSPITGIVTRADATTPGVTAVPTTIFSVVDPTSVVFSMDVDEADIGKIALDQPVQLTLDAYPDRAMTYHVNFIDFVSHKTENGGNAFAVEVHFPTYMNMHQYLNQKPNVNVLYASL